jgi:hypothetical protein
MPLCAACRPETLRPTLSGGLPFSGLRKKSLRVYLFFVHNLQRVCHPSFAFGALRLLDRPLSFASGSFSFLHFIFSSLIFSEKPPNDLRKHRKNERAHFCFGANGFVFGAGVFEGPNCPGYNLIELENTSPGPIQEQGQEVALAQVFVLK